MRRLTLPTLLVCLVATTPAQAQTIVSVAPDTAQATPGQANAYTITVSGDTPATRVRFLLPSHGRPCGYPDETGDPSIGSDADTNFVVTNPAGGIVSGRWITWDGSYAPGSTIHFDVLMPPLGGCFYAGVTADTTSGKVTGLKRGASIFNDQAQAGLATGGSVHAANATARQVTLSWWMQNGSSEPVTLAAERLGASDGFTLDSWTPPLTSVVRLRKGVIWVWHDAVTLQPGQRINAQVYLERPCGVGNANLRLRLTLPDGTSAGTGNGVNVPLAAC